MKMVRKMAGYKEGKLKNYKSCSLRFVFIKVYQKANDEKANKRLPLRYTG